MSSSPKFTATEWDAWIDQFLVSGLPQSVFCEREGLSRFVFARHYRRSDKFAGTRRAPRNTNKKPKDEKVSAFRSVQHKATVVPDQHVGEDVTIHIGQQVRLQCSASVGIEAIMRLVQEARS